MGNQQENGIINQGLSELGLDSEKDSLLFFTKDKEKYSSLPEVWFQLEKAQLYKADAVFFRKGIKDNEYIPQIYIYDFTASVLAEERALTEIHKNVWTGGDIPLVCVFSKTEIKILDTSKPIKKEKDKYVPEYIVENLKTIAKGHNIYNKFFAQKLKAGTYWDNSNIDFYKYSSYSKLTELLRKVINRFTKDSGLADNKDVVQKLIIQCILIKYLEERRDENNNSVFPPSFFEKYDGQQFSDILINGKVFLFFDDLNKNHFNGGIFLWEENQIRLFKGKESALSYLAEVLKGYLDSNDQYQIDFDDNFSRLYSFNYIPVELISRLYEEFIIKEKKKDQLVEGTKKNDGVAYTPSHLVRLLINEVMPINQYPSNIKDYKILDPACGSAIFLVVAFKRLVQWWRQQNNYKKPELKDLIGLQQSLCGVDYDPKAVQISIFSLCIALCDELSPKEIWDDLKFDKLEEKTVYCNDFFLWEKNISSETRFDLIIGNPPFVRGGVKDDLKIWQVNDSLSIDIPQNQIALKFLGDSLTLLKEDGISCLIVKSLPLLYSSSDSSKAYLKALTENFHINQIFDFTPLARNGVLWDGVDVDTAAIFVTKAKPNYGKNILHAIFRRTKTNKERIYFEIDKYDLHFILRQTIYENSYIFKINLLGGGRLNNLYHKYSESVKVQEYLDFNECQANEGFMYGIEGDLSEDFMYEYKTLPTRAFNEDGIDFDQLDFIDRKKKFISIKNRSTYEYPNIIIKENIGKNKIPIYFNDNINFTFKDKLIGIYSLHKNIEPIAKLYKSLSNYQDFHRLIIFITSSQVLIGKNTAILKEDIMRLPILDESFILSEIEKNVINDVLEYTQYFIRKPETAEALKPLKDIQSEISFYGQEFSTAINDLYADQTNLFKLTNIINFEKEGLIGALFSYDSEGKKDIRMINEDEVTGIEGLTHFDINQSLTATRVIQYYTSNKVLFVKPNQKRYWLASIAYRDADSVFADILNEY